MQQPINNITAEIVTSAINVHRELGPGLLESGYRKCLGMEMASRGLQFAEEVPLPLIYRGRQAGCGYRADFLVENAVVVEVKSIDRFEPVHTAQILSYLRLSRCTVGLLLNFNVKWLVDQGIKRVVHGFVE